MYRALSGHAIGIKAPLEKMAALAKKGGFEGVEVGLSEIETLGPDKAQAILDQHNLRPAGAGLPVNYKESEQQYKDTLETLPRLAKVAQAIGCTRINTYIWPCSDELTFRQNYQKHVERLHPVADILGQHGCALSMEFLGPWSVRKDAKYNFVYNMDAMLALCAAIGENVGLLLDCWHWYMAGHHLQDVARLEVADIVYVHVNDVPKGLSEDEVVDTVRCLPGETGVIDVTAFLQTVKNVGYEGPVLVEPFNERVNNMAPEEAVKETASSLEKVWPG